jgi:hypothetical protein
LEKTQAIEDGLNVQHNCHRADCQLTETRTAIVERRKSDNKTLELTHKDDKQYIINLGSLSSPALHRKFSDIQSDQIQPLQWVDSMKIGLAKWRLTVDKKQVNTLKKKTDRVDIKFASREKKIKKVFSCTMMTIQRCMLHKERKEILWRFYVLNEKYELVLNKNKSMWMLCWENRLLT